MCASVFASIRFFEEVVTNKNIGDVEMLKRTIFCFSEFENKDVYVLLKRNEDARN